MTVSAPGKLVLLGDYAVLEGSVAIVAAVDRRARGALGGASAGEMSPVVAAVVEEARRRGVSVDRVPEIDTSVFRDAAGSKLGIGSSSAVAVVASALVLDRGDEAVLDLALSAHGVFSGGEGSGIDVAASYYGGVIATRKQPSDVAPLMSSIGKLELSVLYTGRSASTSELVAAARRCAKWAEYTEAMKKIAAEGLRAWETRSAQHWLSAVARYGRAMASLGRDAGVPIVTEEIEAIMRLADESRAAAAKPSGAGGGDVAIVFSLDPSVPPKIAAATGTTLLSIAVDPRGLSRR